MLRPEAVTRSDILYLVRGSNCIREKSLKCQGILRRDACGSHVRFFPFAYNIRLFNEKFTTSL